MDAEPGGPGCPNQHPREWDVNPEASICPYILLGATRDSPRAAAQDSRHSACAGLTRHPKGRHVHLQAKTAQVTDSDAQSCPREQSHHSPILTLAGQASLVGSHRTDQRHTQAVSAGIYLLPGLLRSQRGSAELLPPPWGIASSQASTMPISAIAFPVQPDHCLIGHLQTTHCPGQENHQRRLSLTAHWQAGFVAPHWAPHLKARPAAPNDRSPRLRGATPQRQPGEQDVISPFDHRIIRQM
ncbi:hypothetical protein NDU88_003672 [Pleurodeles waltl]|uniref:Uncharacterized protein n=1 Tax=Pleurodeles waltl TaxID=8319 RepID=A0AAV7TPN6_PLEWA|nr:hypothetical protein NDU88_003672 [Pleurodeles waltl]